MTTQDDGGVDLNVTDDWNDPRRQIGKHKCPGCGQRVKEDSEGTCPNCGHNERGYTEDGRLLPEQQDDGGVVERFAKRRQEGLMELLEATRMADETLSPLTPGVAREIEAAIRAKVEKREEAVEELRRMCIAYHHYPSPCTCRACTFLATLEKP